MFLWEQILNAKPISLTEHCPILLDHYWGLETTIDESQHSNIVKLSVGLWANL